MTAPVKRSPIHYAEEKWQGLFIDQAGWQVVQMYSSVEKETAVIKKGLALCDQSHRGKVLVEGRQADTLLAVEGLPTGAGQITALGRIYCLRPDLFFLTTTAGGEAAAIAGLEKARDGRDDLLTITDVTHGRAELWVVGAQSSTLLSRLCGLDFHDSQFPSGTAKQSSVAKTDQLIIRHDVADLPAYALIGPRSLGAYLWQTLMETGDDLGLEPVGQAALDGVGRERPA